MNLVLKVGLKKKNGKITMIQDAGNGRMKSMTIKKCEHCGKLLDNSLVTHYSDT